jgi:hypothetical protein
MQYDSARLSVAQVSPGRAGVQRQVLGHQRPVGPGPDGGAGAGRRHDNRRVRPPFNQTTGASQEIIGIKPAEIAKAIFGLTLPINTANNFVLAPVSQLAAPSSPAVAAAVSLYKAADGDPSPARQPTRSPPPSR